MCKTGLLEFDRYVNYNVIKLQSFENIIPLLSSGKKRKDDLVPVWGLLNQGARQIGFLSSPIPF